jgi:hypothetical protein
MDAMARSIVVTAVFASLALAGCGAGHLSATTSRDETVSAVTPTHQTSPPRRQHHPKTGHGAIQKNADMCFKPNALTVDAGESFSGIEPGRPFPGRERIIKTAVHSALIPTVRAELRAAKRHDDAATAGQVREVTAAANRGIAQVTRDPHLLVRGQIRGFDRAQALIERYNLSRC